MRPAFCRLVRPGIALIVVAVIGCARKASDDVQERRPHAMSSSSSSGTAVPLPPASIAVSAPPRAVPPVLGPVRIIPPLPGRSEHDLSIHVDSFGWSSDSERFGYCVMSEGREDTECVFLPHDGPKETFSDWNYTTEKRDPVRAAKQKARVRELDLKSKSGEWAFAGTLDIVWDVQGDRLLRVGARVRGHAPSFSILLRDRQRVGGFGGIEPDAIVVSPDGKWLGAVSHTSHGEFSDEYDVGVVSVARAAAQAYNDAGYELHRAAKWALAADLFRQGADADPTFARPRYNLACAYARLGDPRTESALRAAVAGEGAAETKRKARSDADFASVVNEAWFHDVVRE